MKDVVILQHRLLHYRTGLFNKLRDTCGSQGIRLHLVHGQATRREMQKKDEGTLPWACTVENKFVEVGQRDILWQPYPANLGHADLVIVMQESRIISNYPFLIGRRWSNRKVAYWGHGVNFQSESPNGLRERWKRSMLTAVDWWYAYTDISRDIVVHSGFPEERVTVLNNAIDNKAFCEELGSIAPAELRDRRNHLGISEETPVGLFCGSLYVDKRLDFMISAADRIRQIIPDFCLVIVGDGPSADEMRAAAQTRPWLHCVGVKKGREKAKYFRLASVIFNPGAVGLHVLDAFCAGVPMATTRDAKHGPEIAYLVNGQNGLNTEGRVDAYADAVANLLLDERHYRDLRNSALEAADRYTLDNMVDRFSNGVSQCLNTPKKL